MAKQRILFEAGPMLDKKKTGVGYYIHGLVESLALAHGQDLKLTGFYFDFLGHNHKQPPAIPGLQFQAIRLIPGKLLSLFRRFGLQPFLELFTRKQSDVVLFSNYVSLPMLKRRRSVLVVYDLSYLDVPEFTQSVNLKFMQRFCAPSIQRTDLIITISEFTKARLLHYFPGLKAEIVITPIPPRTDVVEATPLSNQLRVQGIKPQGYLLYLGTIEPRKNLENLVKAYALLSEEVRSQYALVLAGGKGWKDEAILETVRSMQAKGLHIIMPGYITDEDKQSLYANAACFVLPSHYEGFGMPVLEAMQHNIPVALSDIPVFHEVAGRAALYFDKDDPANISAQLTHLLTDAEQRQALIAAGQQQLATFSWQANSARVFEAFQRLR